MALGLRGEVDHARLTWRETRRTKSCGQHSSQHARIERERKKKSKAKRIMVVVVVVGHESCCVMQESSLPLSVGFSLGAFLGG